MNTTNTTTLPRSGLPLAMGGDAPLGLDRIEFLQQIDTTRWSRRPKHNDSGVERIPDYRAQLIRSIIANRSLETHFQPIVDLRSGQTVGAEALARFAQQPVRPPDVWFSDAASVGLGVELELIALRLALEQLHRLPSRLYLSVNASVETITSDHLRTVLADVPAERIVLELTEHTPITDYPGFERSIRDLRSTGLRLAVDDAGSGFSSFRHILDLQPDVIKLDIGLTLTVSTRIPHDRLSDGRCSPSHRRPQIPPSLPKALRHGVSWGRLLLGLSERSGLRPGRPGRLSTGATAAAVAGRPGLFRGGGLLALTLGSTAAPPEPLSTLLLQNLRIIDGATNHEKDPAESFRMRLLAPPAPARRY